MDSQKQQVIAIMAAILESGERARLHSGSHVLSAADFVKRAEVIYTEAMPKDFHFHFAHGGVIPSVDIAQRLAHRILNRTKITKIIDHPQERDVALHVYAVDGEDVETSKGEKLVREPLQDKYEAGVLWRKWILRADEPVQDPKHGGVCVGGARPASDADGFSVVLDCGCRVMKGWRCQFHGAP